MFHSSGEGARIELHHFACAIWLGISTPATWLVVTVGVVASSALATRSSTYQHSSSHELPLTNLQSPDPHPLPHRSVDIREHSLFETASAVG